MIVNAAQTGLDALFSGIPASSGEEGGEAFLALLSSFFAGTDMSTSSEDRGNTVELGAAPSNSGSLPDDVPVRELSEYEPGMSQTAETAAMPAGSLQIVSPENLDTMSISVPRNGGNAFRTTTADGKPRIAIPVEVTVYSGAADEGSGGSVDSDGATETVRIPAVLLLAACA